MSSSSKRSSGSARPRGRGETTAQDLLQIVEPDGTYDSKLEPKLSAEQLKRAYRDLLLVRLLDRRMMSLQRQGRIGFYVPSEGEEACQVGSALALEKGDWIFPAYREPGAALVRGLDLRLMIAQSFGNSLDRNKGRQMPSHYGWKEINFVSASSPVGTQIPHAVGAAWAAKIRGEKIVTIVYFGDGATSQGDFHVSMNFAGVFKTPTVFLCKNNQLAISVPVAKQTASRTLAEKANAYGFEGVRVDGNDVLAVYAATKAAVDKARAGAGPTLIEALTYRIGPHSSSDDPTRYRPKAEVEEWQRKDPIERMRKYLELKRLLTKEADDALHKELEDVLAKTVAEVERAPPPALESLFEDVYEEMPQNLKEQMDEYLKSGERRRPEVLDKFPL